jgi:DNA-binding NtrC family response regulator
MTRASNNQLKRTSVLVVDDERGARMALEAPLRLSGYDVTAIVDGRAAITLGQQQEFDIVLTDVFMPGIGGLEVLRKFRRFSPQTKIIVMTAQGSLEIALQAIEEGAIDFIAKPFNIEEVLSIIKRAAENVSDVRAESSQGLPDSRLIGHSPQMVRAYKLTAYAARTTTTVLIEGESGTGKELIARAIHENSARAARPFTAINCSALTETLLESELFGCAKGSFTGAATDRAGLFESTDGGTILLDELGTTSAAFQASLLRVIQEREVRRIGEREPRKVDVRIIGATNIDL